MNLQTPNDQELEQFIKPVKVKIPHPLKSYFRGKGIVQQKLADYLNIFQPKLSRMFNDKSLMDQEIEKTLYELKLKIDMFEGRTGRKFGE